MAINEQFISLLLSRMPIVFFEIDPGGRLFSIQGDAVKAFRGNAMGQAPRSLHTLAPEHSADIEAALTPGGKSRWVSFCLRDGEPCWTEFLLSFNESRGEGALGMAIDVSEEHGGNRLAQRLSESHERSTRLESMGYLISLFSSDLNNFLSVAAGNMRAVQRHLSDKPHHSHRVQAAFRAMDGATQNSQKLARAIRPSAPILRSLSIQSLLEAVIDWATLNLGEQFQFELIAAADLPHLTGDEEQVSEILRILLRNATEAMPEGGLVIVECDCVESEAHSKKTRQPRPFLRISVNDGGAGIPDPILERIFDPCYSTKPRHEGLGLTRAHALAGGHHGYLTVSSDPGMGSTFEVFLPVASPVQQGYGLENTSPAPAAVLVYEEDENSRIAMERVLSACGYRADCFGDAEIAFGAWRARSLAGNAYRAVLVGWSGKGAGMQFWKDILSADARARGIAVLPFGGRMGEHEVASHGLCGALRSPLSLDQVGRVVGEAVRQQRRRPA